MGTSVLAPNIKKMADFILKAGARNEHTVWNGAFSWGKNHKNYIPSKMTENRMIGLT